MHAPAHTRTHTRTRMWAHVHDMQIVKLFKTLVRTDKYDFVTFWDFVTSYDWIAQALRIYNVPT